MKKIFILLLSVVALLAFTASAFALHGVKEMLDYTPSVVKAKQAQVELYGHYRIRGSIKDNTSDFEDTDDNDPMDKTDDAAADYDQRVRFGIKATVSPQSQAVLEVETGSGNSDAFGWGSSSAGSGGVYRAGGNVKKGAMEIRQAYVSHQTTALGPLAGFKAGHMLIALGTGTYYNHTKGGDDGILFWVQPQDNTEIAFAILKGEENSGNDNDIDIYALTLETAAGAINLSGDISYLHDNAGTFGQFDLNNATLWNIGVRAGTDLQGIGVNAGCDFQSGEIDAFKDDSDDMDLSGWQCQIGASTKVGEASVHAKFAYGSGDDIDSEDDYEGFITSLSSGGNVGTFVYDNSTTTAAQRLSTNNARSSDFANANTNGLANTMYLNVGATTNLTPDLSANAEVFYLVASEEVSNTSELDDDDIGVEVDGKLTYQIDTGVAWYIEAGILFAGDFYKNVTTMNNPTPETPDNVWRIRQGLVFNF
jgi:hypothetical protein